jgi:hypothetical protein
MRGRSFLLSKSEIENPTSEIRLLSVPNIILPVNIRKLVVRVKL